MNEQSSLFDGLFEKLELSETATPETFRAVVELSFVESRSTGGKVHFISRLRARKCLGLGEGQELPVAIERRISAANANWGNNKKRTEQHFLYLRGNDKRGMYLPFQAFSRETKRRIFEYFAPPIRQEIQKLKGCVVPRAIASVNEMLDRLALLCDSNESLKDPDRVAGFTASLAVKKEEIEAIKEEICRASSEEKAARLETSLKRLLHEKNQIASELQRLKTKSV